jgi:hypothetical protein
LWAHEIVKALNWTDSVAVIATIGIQVFPVDRMNPPITEAGATPPEVMAILKRARFDFHSNETTWPWYSYEATVSWLVRKDVKEGREELSFS